MEQSDQIASDVTSAQKTNRVFDNLPPAQRRAETMVRDLGIADIYKFKHHFHHLSGGEMHYVDEGAGEPVVMLHGNPTWSFLYREFIAAFSKTHRVIVPDHLGFGLSDKPKGVENYTLEFHVANLEALMLSQDLNNITLVLHDWGGPIGLAFAARHPDRIKAIVVMNTLAFFPLSPQQSPEKNELPLVLKIFRSRGLGTFLVRTLGIFERFLLARATGNSQRIGSVKRAYSGVFPTPEQRDGVLAFPRMIPATINDLAAQIMTREIVPYLKSYSKPMQVFWGMRDPIMPLEVLEGWRAHVPHAEVIQLPEGRHYVQEDSFGTIIPAMRAFLRRPAPDA